MAYKSMDNQPILIKIKGGIKPIIVTKSEYDKESGKMIIKELDSEDKGE